MSFHRFCTAETKLIKATKHLIFGIFLKVYRLYQNNKPLLLLYKHVKVKPTLKA